MILSVRRAFSSTEKSLTALFPGMLEGVKAQASLAIKLTQPHELGVQYNNVMLNPDRDSNFNHIEFTPDSVRLEFKTARQDDYRRLAEIKTGFTEDDSGLSELIKDVKNQDFCGGGAVVIIDREKLKMKLYENLKRHREGLLAAESGAAITPEILNSEEFDESTVKNDIFNGEYANIIDEELKDKDQFITAKNN